MAVTKIWNIRGKAGSPLEYIANPEKTEREFTEPEKQALQDVIAYTTNEDKTEKFYYTSGINCSVEFARDQFDTVKMRFGKYDGNVAYHAYQSFRDHRSAAGKGTMGRPVPDGGCDTRQHKVRS